MGLPGFDPSHAAMTDKKDYRACAGTILEKFITRSYLLTRKASKWEDTEQASITSVMLYNPCTIFTKYNTYS